MQVRITCARTLFTKAINSHRPESIEDYEEIHPDGEIVRGHFWGKDYWGVRSEKRLLRTTEVYISYLFDETRTLETPGLGSGFGELVELLKYKCLNISVSPLKLVSGQ